VARNRDPFALALDTLRERAAGGAFHPERSIVIKDEARALGLSTTPVREALARLCGEGLVQRAASGGYLGVRLDPDGVRSLYRFRLWCLQRAVSAGSQLPMPHASRPLTAGGPPNPAAPVFERLVRRSGDLVLQDAVQRTSAQLAILAPSEIRLIGDVQAEAEDLAGQLSRWDLPALSQALARFHERRIELAIPLLLDLESEAVLRAARR
jgi:DNA-binding GntR family transcriptional regulator